MVISQLIIKDISDIIQMKVILINIMETHGLIKVIELMHNHTICLTRLIILIIMFQKT